MMQPLRIDSDGKVKYDRPGAFNAVGVKATLKAMIEYAAYLEEQAPKEINNASTTNN
jgi:hypothetical protein